MKRIKYLPFVLKDVHTHGKGFFWLFIIKTILNSGRIYVSAFLGREMFNELLIGITSQQITSKLLSLVFGIVLFDILFALINSAIDYYSEISATKYSNHFTIKNSQKCSCLKFEYHDNPTQKDNVKQFLSDSGSIINSFCQVVTLIVTVVSFVTSLFISLRFSVLITCFSLLVAFPSFFIRKKNKNADYQLEKQLNLTDRIIDYFKNVCTGRAFYQEIHVLGAISFFTDRLKYYLEVRTEERIRYRKAKLVRELFLILIYAAVNIIINLCVIVFIIIKNLTIGDYSYYTSIINNLKNNSNSLVSSFNELYISLKKVENYYSFYNSKENEYSYGTKPMPSVIEKITFSHVYFKYPQSHEYVLNDVSFEVSQSEKIALAGVNGAGKTTIISLLLRFYDPTKGEILINDCNIKYYRLDEYRNHFSCMFQQSNLYNISLRDNLLLGVQDTNVKINDNALVAFLSSLGIKLTIEDLSMQVSKQFDERGMIFSPGQAQKLNVVRTLLNDKHIVVFDEPSSSMDSITEDLIMETAFSFANNKMLFFISHRLSNMKKVDKIVFLEKGRIVEQGNHSELMQKQSAYYNFFIKQANKYS